MFVNKNNIVDKRNNRIYIFFMNSFWRKIYNFFKILKINFRQYRLNKQKERLFRDLGFLVYEFYDIDKNFIDDDEIKDLILKLKDIEIEFEELDNLIDEIRLSNLGKDINEKEEISNELLLKGEGDEQNKGSS